MVADPFYNNGVAHSLWSVPVDMGMPLGPPQISACLCSGCITGANGTGWVQLETVLVRLNTTHTPHGSFPLLGDLLPPGAAGRASDSRVGFDAAVCVELYEPWVLDTANATAGLPHALRIAGPGSRAGDAAGPLEVREGAMLPKDVARGLNSTGKFSPFVVAHDNSVNQIIKVPSPPPLCSVLDSKLTCGNI